MRCWGPLGVIRHSLLGARSVIWARTRNVLPGGRPVTCLGLRPLKSTRDAMILCVWIGRGAQGAGSVAVGVWLWEASARAPHLLSSFLAPCFLLLLRLVILLLVLEPEPCLVLLALHDALTESAYAFQRNR